MSYESTYPALIDAIAAVFNYDAATGSGTILGEATCNMRGNAILAVQNTLGENPQGIYTDVAERLMAMDASLAPLILGQYPSGLFVDEISEYTTGSGVLLDGVRALDGVLYTNFLDEFSVGSGVVVNCEMGVGISTVPVAQLEVEQPSTTGAKPVLQLEQKDVDEVLMKFIGTAAAASADRTLVANSDYGTPGALTGWIQVHIQDDGDRVTDGDYYIPFYAAPT